MAKMAYSVKPFSDSSVNQSLAIKAWNPNYTGLRVQVARQGFLNYRRLDPPATHLYPVHCRGNSRKALLACKSGNREEIPQASRATDGQGEHHSHAKDH